MIKDAIKEELLRRLRNEWNILQKRMNCNTACNVSNYDTQAEERFLEEMFKFANSI